MILGIAEGLAPGFTSSSGQVDQCRDPRLWCFARHCSTEDCLGFLGYSAPGQVYVWHVP